MKEHGPTAFGGHSSAAVFCEAIELAATAPRRDARPEAEPVRVARASSPVLRPTLAWAVTFATGQVWGKVRLASQWLEPRPATRSALAAASAVVLAEMVLLVIR